MITINNLFSSSLLLLVLALTGCSGGGGGSNGGTSTPVALGPMNHPVSFDPKSDVIPTAKGQVANSFFGATHDNAKIVFNSTGDGMAVWKTESATGIVKIVYSAYDALTELWSLEDTLFVITDVSTPSAFKFSLAASNTGFAISWKVSSVYEVTDANVQEWNNYNYAKVYENGSWSSSMLLNVDTKPYNLSFPLVSSNGSTFMFAWEENFAIATREWNASVMSDPKSANVISSVYRGDMALVSNGSSYMLKYEDSVSSYLNSYMTAIEYTSGSWADPVTTEATQGNISKSVIASDSSGYLMTWIQDGAAQYRHYSNGNWAAMAAMTAGPTGAHKITSNGSSYLISWVSASDLNIKTFNSGSWGTTEIPESLTDSISTYDAVGTNTGYAFSLLAHDLVTPSYDLYLLNYTGGSGSSVLVELNNFDVSEHKVFFGDNKTWLVWKQFDGTDMLLKKSAYQDTTNIIAESALTTNQHGGGVTSGKVASTALGVKVAAWSQSYFDASGNKINGAFARVVDNSGNYGSTVFLRNYSTIRDIVTIGETLVVILNASDGLAVVEYKNNTWSSVTSLTASFVYSWHSEVANGRLMIAWENVNDIRASIYDAGAWSAITTLNTSGVPNGYIEMSSNNEDFMVTWKEFLPANTSVTPYTYPSTINSRFYDASLAQWNTESIVDTYESIVGGFSPKIIGSNNGFLIAWTRADTTAADSAVSLYSSICNVSGVCSTGSVIEPYSTSIGGLKLASNGTGYMIQFTYNYSRWSVLHDGVNWNSPISFSVDGHTIELLGNGNDYLAFWYEYGQAKPINVSRYTTANGWALPDAVIAGSDTTIYNSFDFIPIGSNYAVAWTIFKPNQDYQKYDLYMSSWNGSTWSGSQQINTGKFSVTKYNTDVVNNTLRLNWIQAHESLSDSASPALWEFMP